MPRGVRPALLSLAILLATLAAPARAEVPAVLLVSASTEGGLVKVTLVGRVALVSDLVAPAEDVHLMPSQANGANVSYTVETERRGVSGYDVTVVDADTGARTVVTRDGRSGHLLVSPDGRFRYILTTNETGALLSLVRTDAKGKNRKVLVAGPAGRTAAKNDVRLSGSGISPDGRSIYVASTAGTVPSTLYAVSTSTGAKRVITFGTGPHYIWNVVASPDGKTLAVSYTTGLDEESGMVVALVRVAGGEVSRVSANGEVFASAFTPDGGGLVLSQHAYIGRYDEGLSIADLATGVVTQIAGTEGLFQAVAVR